MDKIKDVIEDDEYAKIFGDIEEQELFGMDDDFRRVSGLLTEDD